MPPSASPYILPSLLTLLFSLQLLYHSYETAASPCFYGWGRNDRGQLSTEPSLQNNIPQPTPFGHGILHNKKLTHISAGFTHAVILDSEGNSYCVGSNSKGECGQGITGDDILHPKQIVSDEAFDEKKIVFGSAGHQRTYLLDDKGQVYFLGVNDLIEVSPKSFKSPMGMTFSRPVSKISVGNDFTLLLTEHGDAYAFGDNSVGQLGSGSNSTSKFLPVAVDTSGALHGKTIIEISAGGQHNLVLSSDGEVFGFGSNEYGQLGIGKILTEEFLPVSVNTSEILGRGENITQITAGSYHSLILSSNGKIFGFGNDECAQLGTGSTSRSTSLPVAVFMSGVLRGKNISQMSAGTSHSIVLSSDGEVFGFGENKFDQLGNGGHLKFEVRPVAAGTNGVLYGKIIKQVSAGSHFTVLLSSDGEVFAFGVEGFFQQKISGKILKDEWPPLVLSNGFSFSNSNITHFSETHKHFLLRDDHGNVISSGANEYSQLGDGLPVSHRPSNRMAILFKAFQISAGYLHSLVLSSEGKVYGFGNNKDGQLGVLHTAEFVPSPVAVNASGVLSGKTIVEISAGGEHSLVLSSDGEVFGFGSSKYGQLGIGKLSSAEFLPVAVNTSEILGHGETITQITTGRYHSLILSSNGKVFGFGNDEFAQLGTGNSSGDQTMPVAMDTSDVLYGKSIIQISAGSFHSLVLSSDGKVFGFGYNGYGQLGVNAVHSSHFISSPVEVDTSGVLHGKYITQISAGQDHSLLLSSNRKVFAFGSNEFSQLGNGGQVEQSFVPVLVNLSKLENHHPTGSSSPKIFAGAEHSLLSFCYTRTCFGKDHLHPLVCLGRGECVADDTCSCQVGYAPPSCQHPICSGKPSTDPSVCSGKGNCTSPHHCECEEGFHGLNCQNHLCHGVSNINPSVCQGHGKCLAPDQCSCERDYEGKVCDVRKRCYGIASSDTARVCSGHGKCAQVNICECHWIWSGSKCESLSTGILFIIITCSITALAVICIFGGSCSGIVVTSVALFCRVRLVEKEKKLTEYLLQGFVQDTEMDTLDADSQRARFIVQQSMVEIDFSELSDLKKIASGGSGATVFRAKWNGSSVAVKVFKSGLMSGENFFDEFEREVSLMSTLRHRNVINFYGCSLAYPRIAIVMELCDPGSIETLIENGSLEKKSSHEILQMLLDIAEGMCFLHSRQVIHRDLKCANVLIDEHGVCKLTDFGLSKYTKDQVEKAHTVGIGTSYYIAPELANGSGEYDFSVDVYAFGILAMELCLGRMCPFPDANADSGSNARDVHRRSLQDSSYRPDVSELDQQYAFLGWVLQQCWHENPKSRPPFRDVVKILRSSLFDTDA